MPKISVGESFTVALISVSEKNWIGGWEYQDSPLKILSHSAENFRSGIFHCCINFGYRKRLEKRGRGVPRFRSKNFCLTVPKISVGESFTDALFSGSEKVYGQEGGRGVPRFSVEKFLSHSAENFRRGILYCCINFGYRENLEKRGGGGDQDFPSKFFCLTVPKIFVGESFTVALFSGSEKVYGQEGGRGVLRFSLESLLPHSAENLRRESFTVALISGTEKIWGRGRGGGVPRFSVENFLSHSAENFRRGMLCCINFRNRKGVEKGGGSIKIFRRKFFVSHCRRKFP